MKHFIPGTSNTIALFCLDSCADYSKASRTRLERETVANLLNNLTEEREREGNKDGTYLGIRINTNRL
jgi:hypothetical protein